MTSIYYPTSQTTIECLPLTETQLKARDVLVKKVLEPGESLTKEDFYAGLSDAPPYLYDVFMQTKKEFEKHNLKRICGNPAIVHPLGALFNVNDYTQLKVNDGIITHPQRDVILTLDVMHDLEEDCGVSAKELEKKLSRIEELGRLEIPYKKELVDYASVLYKEKSSANGLTEEEFMAKRLDINKDYWDKILVNALDLKASNDPLYDVCFIAKQGDHLDNLDTVVQILEKTDMLIKTLIKTRIGVTHTVELLNVEFNPFVFALQTAIIDSALRKIPRAKERISSNLEAIKLDLENGLARYGTSRFDIHPKRAAEYIDALDEIESFLKEVRG